DAFARVQPAVAAAGHQPGVELGRRGEAPLRLPPRRRLAGAFQRFAQHKTEPLHRLDFTRRMRVYRAMLHVYDPKHPVAEEDWHGKKSLKAVLRKVGVKLETRIAGGFFRQRHGAPLLRHPSGDAFADSHAELPQL